MPLAIGKMTVNVSLCGAVPRGARENVTTNNFNKQGAPAPPASTHSPSPKTCDRSKTAPFLNGDNLKPSQLAISISHSEDSQDSNMTALINRQHVNTTLPVVEPPRWAVPAKGEARLEPVCEALGTHGRVDLTSRACFRIGRSPTSDVQLMHGTSSRRHALLFHHPNGHCYVVDCGSAHGTFVNGVRVRSTPSAGMVAPHRVRRGALIRFGGPGAPSFVLKSFSVGFSYMVKDLESPSCYPTLSPSFKTTQVQHIANTSPRINNDCTTIGILRKRSFDETTEERPAKRRCVSPFSPESSPRLVSPCSRRVTFNDVPQAFYPSLVSPDLSADDASL
jgi:hypothetical protein